MGIDESVEKLLKDLENAKTTTEIEMIRKKLRVLEDQKE